MFGACLIPVLNTEGFRLIGSIFLAFTLYSSACSFSNYYNPMVQGLLVIALVISCFYYFSKTSAGDWHINSATVESSGMLPFSEMVLATVVSFLCLVANVIFMNIGFKKAKMPGYNKAFSVNLKNRPASIDQQQP